MTTLPPQVQSIIAANSAVYKSTLSPGLIRILKLLPGDVNNPLSCSFVAVDLKNSGTFHALSYCWGNEQANSVIHCNGEEFKVTKNLYTALKKLRSVKKVQSMWIDAICINQDNLAEKSQQVPLMGQIYQNAEQVTVWLGAETNTTTLAISTMHRILECCCAEFHGPGGIQDYVARLSQTKDWDSLRVGFANMPGPDWPDDPRTCTDALRSFFGLPWFSRIWVIQEVRSHSNVVVRIGDATMPWAVVALTAAWVVYGPSPVTRITEPYKFGGFLHTDFMNCGVLTTRDDVPFLEVLDRCRAFQCSVDVDRVFAILTHPAARLQVSTGHQRTLAKDVYPLGSGTSLGAPHFGIKVDYNLSLIELYRQVVLGSISEGGSLQILSHALEDQDGRKGYPSWMPVWHKKSSRFTGPRRTFLYEASKDTTPKLSIHMNPMLIDLQGLIAGTIVETRTSISLQTSGLPKSTLFQFGVTLKDFKELSRLIVRDCWQPEHNWLQEPMCRAGSRANDHFKDFCAYISEKVLDSTPTIVSLHGKWCNVCGERHIASPANDMEQELVILHCGICLDFDLCLNCHRSGKTCPGKHTLSPKSIPSLICKLKASARLLLNNRKEGGNSARFDLGVRQSFDQQKFFDLDTGYLGVGSEQACVQDIVVVFLGARVPFLLRKRGTAHTIVGECYVSGLMDGEILQLWQNGQQKEVTFTLA